MPSFPRIDSPCPLSAEEQRAIDGHCERCDKHVHALNDMNEAERRALLANATGPICVSYRKAVPRRVGRIGAAIAATLITTTAYAGDPASPPVAQPTVAAALQDVQQEEDGFLDEIVFVGGVNDPQDASAVLDMSVPALPMHLLALVPGGGQDTDQEEALDEIVVVGGGIHVPADAEWVDEESLLPALPMIAAQDELPAGSDGSR
ncbi:MAG: hypothetical protein V4673_14185 [Pseudomonadota bacterium]